VTVGNRAAPQSEEEDNAWETGTGMADQFVGYIEGAFFGVDENYNPDAMLFQANLVGEDGEPVTTIKYSVGQEWEASADGSEISHPSKTKINNSSRYGRFIDRLAMPTNTRAPKSSDVIAPKGKENGLGLLDLLKSRGTPLQASSLEGLGFFWEQHQMSTMSIDPDTNKPVTKSVLLPTAYVGVAGKQAAATAAAPRTAAAAPRAAAPARPAAPTAAAANGEEAPDVDIPASLRKRLTPLAQSSTAKDFVRQMAKDKEVLALPDDVMNFILASGPNGFWQSVKE
jgi:hypothetical protein